MRCQWCLRERSDIKKVQILKWAKECSKGIRNVCKECREHLRHEIRVVRNGKIKLNGQIKVI